MTEEEFQDSDGIEEMTPQAFEQIDQHVASTLAKPKVRSPTPPTIQVGSYNLRAHISPSSNCDEQAFGLISHRAEKKKEQDALATTAVSQSREGTHSSSREPTPGMAPAMVANNYLHSGLVPHPFQNAASNMPPHPMSPAMLQPPPHPPLGGHFPPGPPTYLYHGGWTYAHSPAPQDMYAGYNMAQQGPYLMNAANPQTPANTSTSATPANTSAAEATVTDTGSATITNVDDSPADTSSATVTNADDSLIRVDSTPANTAVASSSATLHTAVASSPATPHTAVASSSATPSSATPHTADAISSADATSVTPANTADASSSAHGPTPIPASPLRPSTLKLAMDDMSELSEEEDIEDKDNEDNDDLQAESKVGRPSLECKKILDEGIKAINGLIYQMANDTGRTVAAIRKLVSGRFGGQNSWNAYGKYFVENLTQELARLPPGIQYDRKPPLLINTFLILISICSCYS